MASSVDEMEQALGVPDESSFLDFINMLDNVCLKKIFLYLSPGDRLNAEKVCKRWRAVSKVSWNNLKRLNFTKSDTYSTDFDKLPDIYKNIQSIAKILRRCGRYLRVLKLGKPCHYTMLPFVTKYCENLGRLNVCLSPAGNNISSISQIKSLTHFCLERMSNNSDSAVFRILPCETLRGLHLITGECRYDYNIDGERSHLPDNYEYYLRNLKNLTSITIRSFHLDDAMETIINQNANVDSLSLADCTISGTFFITALTNLQYLNLQNVLAVDNSFLDPLSRTCRKLVHLVLAFCSRIDDNGVMHLWRLPELKVLSLDSMCLITDGSLIGLRTLRELSCEHCRGIRNGEVITLLRIAPDLRVLNLIGTGITRDVLFETHEVTKRRANGLSLKMFVDTSVTANWIANNDSPLLIVETPDDARHPRRPRGERVYDDDDDYNSSYEFQYEYGSDSESNEDEDTSDSDD
ncbi:F-box/LRR-repeat protein 14 [Diachasma alloeum]|uniref:F-box/LRR-repeat protein 14 n=1 Tax=Diachasma alloeum TaxID=454923 RepID=UPI0007384B39|nr:F-box/LRR-repeat protein 14 [Diachasma alloeum]